MSALKIFSIFLIGLTVFTEGNVYAEINEVNEKKQADPMISTLTGLDFNQIDFVVWTHPEFSDRLYVRALNHFAQAGLYKKQGKKPGKNATANLDLTLRIDASATPHQEGSMRMYQRTLKLTEIVSPLNHPQVTLPAVTWSVGFSKLIENDESPTIEKFKEDLDRLVFEFIRSYKMGNPN